MIYSAFQPILALHIMNFSSCQNYWGGGGKTICLPPPPPPYKYIYYFCRYIWGSCPPNTKKLATLVHPSKIHGAQYNWHFYQRFQHKYEELFVWFVHTIFKDICDANHCYTDLLKNSQTAECKLVTVIRTCWKTAKWLSASIFKPCLNKQTNKQNACWSMSLYVDL